MRDANSNKNMIGLTTVAGKRAAGALLNACKSNIMMTIANALDKNSWSYHCCWQAA
jgi:hypothetical protein